MEGSRSRTIKNKLNYYLKLPFEIEVEQIPEEEGGGYVARLPELGRYTLAGDGDTPQDAIQSLEEIKKIMFRLWIEQGISFFEILKGKHPYP